MAEVDVRVEQHRNEALRLLGIALDEDSSASSTAQRNLIAAAQVHAALAQAVAQDRTRRAVDHADPHRASEMAAQSSPKRRVRWSS